MLLLSTLQSKEGKRQEHTQVRCAVSAHLSLLTPKSLAAQGMKQTAWVAHLILDSPGASCKPQILCL